MEAFNGRFVHLCVGDLALTLSEAGPVSSRTLFACCFLLESPESSNLRDIPQYTVLLCLSFLSLNLAVKLACHMRWCLRVAYLFVALGNVPCAVKVDALFLKLNKVLFLSLRDTFLW